MTQVLIRPAREADLEALAAITATSYYEVDARTFQRSWPDPQPRPPARNGHWIKRARHTLATDPEGCWVAEVDGEVVGGAISRVRELMWILASFAVKPEHQGQGIGEQLLAAALHHGRGCLRGMFAASADPGAVRRYRLAGFTLHPQMFLTGVVDRDAIPVVERVRDGTAGDIDLLDSIDRQTRGAAHLSDHEVLLDQFRLIVCERSNGAGLRLRRRVRLAVAARGHHAAYGARRHVGGTRILRARLDRGGPPHHRGQRVGHRRRHGRADVAAPERLPVPARDEAADALPASRFVARECPQ